MFDHHSNLFCLACLLILAGSGCLARPGGYTATGGVYDQDLPKSEWQDAILAGKLAHKYQESDPQLVSNEVAADRRTGQQVPTFFTSPEYHQALIQAFRASHPPARSSDDDYFYEYLD